MARTARPAALLAVVLALGVTAGCGGEPAGDEAAFCASVRTRRAELLATPPPPGTDAARAHVAAYAELADVAPRVIRAKVAELGELYERYADLDMESDRAVGDFYVDANADEARAASVDVTDFVSERCGIELDPGA